MKSLSRILPAAVLSLALPVVAFGAEPQPDQALDKAKALFDAGKWGEADCILDEYSKRHPAPSRLSEALVLQGRCREKRGDFAAAQKLYGRVAHDDAMLRKDPEAVAAAYDRLHALQVSQGASATSRRRLIDECRRRIRNADALSRICEREGDALAAAGDFRGALASYKAAPSLSEPGHAVMALLAGGTAPSRRITGGDIETLSKIAEAKPDLARPLCLALSKCRDGWLAEDFLASSLLAGGKSEKAAEIWAGMVKRRIGPTDSIAYSYCEALAETRPQEAMAELDRWLANNRKSPLAEKARLTRARLEAAHGDRERAAAMFEKFVSDFQQSALADIARHELAEILKTIAIAEAQKAKEVARAEAAKRNPLLAKVEAGEALLRQRKYREAARAFVALRTSASPAMRDRVLYGLGEALHGLGDCNGAIDAFRAAARIGASATNGVHAAKAYRAIGDILLEDTGEHGKAVAAYEKSMALRPDMADDGFWMNYGLALMVSGREEDAAWIFAERRDKVRDNIAEFAKWDNLAKACSKGREEKRH